MPNRWKKDGSLRLIALGMAILVWLFVKKRGIG